MLLYLSLVQGLGLEWGVSADPKCRGNEKIPIPLLHTGGNRGPRPVPSSPAALPWEKPGWEQLECPSGEFISINFHRD